MAITRSQIARQLLAEGGAPNPRKPFQSGDLAARDDSYGTLSGGESPASTGGDNEMVFDQRFQDIVTAPETVGFTRGSDAAEFIKSNLATGLSMIANKPGINTGINILRNIFPDTGQTYVRGVDRFGTGDDSETTRIGNRIVQPMMPMTPKLPSDIEPEQSDMQEFVQRFTLPERFRLSNGGITGIETAMKEARKAHDKYKKSGGKLSFDRFIALGDEGVAKFFAEGGEVRQAYGLGSLVKSITKPIKKVLKSDVGKAALIGAAAFGIPGTQFGGLFGRQAIGGGAKGIFGGYGLGDFFKQQAISERGGEIVFGKSPFRKALSSLTSPRGAAAAILGTSALAGTITPEEEVESLSSRISDRTGIDVEAIRKEVQAAYASGDLSGLKSKYPFLIPTEAARAEGGRIGFDEGGKDLSSDPNYRGWVKIYETDPELAKMNDNHGRYLEFYNSQKKAEGGRIGAEEGGLMNLGGNEMDLRGGGFVPIGVAEKADDVPARLSKNEFVFTADAVRAAGGGSVDRGADLMYKTMKQLENQVA
jgi:hypothetical protein